MGVLKVKVDGVWVPVTQSFGLPTAGSVGWAQLAADLGWGFAAVADVPGLAVTFNADPTHIYKTSVHMTVSQATADATLVFAISNGANAILKRVGHFQPLNREQSVNYSLVETGISGTQTRKVQIYSGTANLTTVRGGSLYTPQIIVEDVTPSGGATQPGMSTGTFAPTLAGFVIGTGGTPVNTAFYTFIGAAGVGGVGQLTVDGVMTLGTTGFSVAALVTMTLPPGFNLPADAAVSNGASPIAGSVNITGPSNNVGALWWNAADKIRIVVHSNQTQPGYITYQALGPTIPFTWAAGNSIYYRYVVRAVRV